MTPELPRLQALLGSLSPLDADEWAFLASRLKPRRLARGEHWYQPGDPVDQVAFVGEGLLRIYHILDAKEHTRNFFPAPSFFTESIAFHARRPTQFFVQALEDTRLWVLSRSEAEAVFDQSLGLARLGRRLLEWNLAGLAERLIDRMVPSADQKYLDLRHSRPDLFQRVPQYMIASYLGMTPEALSRVISRSQDSAP